MRSRGHDIRVMNGSISGDTTAGGRARLGWALSSKPDFVIVALGGNDGLRGLDPAETRANLGAILARLKEGKIPVLLAGMKAPRNLGPEYEAAFNGAWPELAKRYGAVLYPFFLDGVALDPALNQPDLIHPNAAGVAVIVERILPYVEKLLAGSPARGDRPSIRRVFLLLSDQQFQETLPRFTLLACASPLAHQILRVIVERGARTPPGSPDVAQTKRAELSSGVMSRIRRSAADISSNLRMVRFDMRPRPCGASRAPCSWAAARTALSYCLVIARSSP